VVVTGASTGIGAATALRLVDAGFTVFAGVRRDEDGERLLSERPHGLVPLRIDVTDAESIDAAVATVSESVGTSGLAGLVNNAGIDVAGPLEFVPLDQVRRMFDINVMGLLAVTQAFLELLRVGRGRLVNIGSMAGRSTMPFNGPYSATKHAVESISDAFRVELKPWGIDVACVEPGAIATPIWEKSKALAMSFFDVIPERAHELYDRAVDATLTAIEEVIRNAVPPERVADAVEHALTAKRPRTRYLVGTDAKVQTFLHAILPDRLFDALVIHVMKLPT